MGRWRWPRERGSQPVEAIGHSIATPAAELWPHPTLLWDGGASWHAGRIREAYILAEDPSPAVGRYRAEVVSYFRDGRIAGTGTVGASVAFPEIARAAAELNVSDLPEFVRAIVRRRYIARRAAERRAQ